MVHESRKDFQAKEREKSAPNQALTRSHGVRLQQQNGGAMEPPCRNFLPGCGAVQSSQQHPRAAPFTPQQPPLSLPDGAALSV